MPSCEGTHRTRRGQGAAGHRCPAKAVVLALSPYPLWALPLFLRGVGL